MLFFPSSVVSVHQKLYYSSQKGGQQIKSLRAGLCGRRGVACLVWMTNTNSPFLPVLQSSAQLQSWALARPPCPSHSTHISQPAVARQSQSVSQQALSAPQPPASQPPASRASAAPLHPQSAPLSLSQTFTPLVFLSLTRMEFILFECLYLVSGVCSGCHLSCNNSLFSLFNY